MWVLEVSSNQSERSLDHRENSDYATGTFVIISVPCESLGFVRLVTRLSPHEIHAEFKALQPKGVLLARFPSSTANSVRLHFLTSSGCLDAPSRTCSQDSIADGYISEKLFALNHSRSTNTSPLTAVPAKHFVPRNILKHSLMFTL